MTLAGSHQHSTDNSPALTSSKVVGVGTITGTAAEFGYGFEAPDRGRHGIRVYTTDQDTNEQTTIATLPPIAGRYQRGDGLVYIIPAAEWAEQFHAQAVDLSKGDVWHKLGYTDAAVWARSSSIQAQTFWRIWHHVAKSWPVAPTSPRVTEALPPLAPPLAPLTEDVEAARRAWAWIGQRLTPAGRLMVGLALTSPWIEQVGATSLVAHMWGKAGEGKSLAARVCAAVYGDHRDDEGLFGTFNSSGQGIPSYAQSLSYLPLILDEVNTSTGDVEPTLISLVTGASRKRSSRSGAAVKSGARWTGAVITTGNDPLALRHEMFDRRLFELQAEEVWTGRPVGTVEAAEFWAQIADVLPTMAGWPWVEFCRDFEPGQPSAGDIRHAVTAIAMPGPGNLGMVARLAEFGCMWMTDWTGTPWDDGVHDAAAAMVAGRSAEIRDPARDASRAVMESWAMNPAAWRIDADHAPRDLAGFRAQDINHPCELEHGDEGECLWLNIHRSTFEALVETSMARLARTPFRRVVYTLERDRLTRKVSVSGAGRVRMITACTGGMARLSEAAPIGTAAAPPLAVFENRPPTPAPATSSTPAPAPAPDKARRFAASTDDNETRGLDAAERDGITDVVGPMIWLPDRLSGGWDAGGWNGYGNGSGMIRRGDTAIRMWRAPNGRTSPAEFSDALAQFHAETSAQFTSPANLVQRLLIGHEGSRAPRWQLPDKQAELWTTATVMHPVQWGERDATATSWDRNRSHLGAITQANIAPLWFGEDFEHHGTDAPVDRKIAGMYRIEVPQWDSPLPGPHGSTEPGAELWTTPEIMRLYAERGITPRIIEAWLAPTHRVPQVEAAAEQLKKWLEQFANRPARIIPKLAYQAFAGSVKSEHVRGKRHRVFRPDWGQAIADNSWANVLRQAYRTYDADARYVPVRVNVDALYYPAELGDGTPPTMTLGTGLGQYKTDAQTADLATPPVDGGF